MSLSVSGKEIRLVFERDNLLRSLTEAVRGLPGAVAFYIFGSLVEGRGDAWSDLDIEIVTTDVEVSRDCLFPILETVRPMELAWIIDSSSDDWAASVLFQQTSLFHKVDLGIRSIHGFDRNPIPQPSALIWSQQTSRRVGCSELAAPPFMPEPDSEQHILLGHLLATTRYVRARKRDHLATCWRFASALADAVFAAHYRRAVNRGPFHGRLGTLEYQVLDRQRPQVVSMELMSMLDFSSPVAMDRTVYLLMHELVDVFRDDSTPQRVPAAIGDGFYAFARRELAIP